MTAGKTFTVTEEMRVQRCPSCGIAYAVPQSWYDDLVRLHHERGDESAHYCPNGHRLTFSGESNLAKAERERDRLKQDNARLIELRDAAEKAKFAAEREIKRQAGRTAAGVCPCCSRSFRQLAAHMRNQHPSETATSLRHRGGVARAARLTAERRIEIARKGAAARWGKETVQ